MKYYYNIKANDPCPFGGEGAVALHDASVPVDVLFSENDSCGEAVPQENVQVQCRLPDGTIRPVRFEMGENIVLAHEDISREPLI